MTSSELTATLEQLRPWAESETGMVLSGDRLPRLQAAAERVLGATGENLTPELRKVLARPDDHGAFLERLSAELTVGESFFQRNKHHFSALRDHVIPAIMAQNARSRTIRVWSAGCSTGEEPYSVAILLDEVLAARGEGAWDARILGTDLNHAFLKRAREAVYRPWSFRQTTIHEDTKYFTRDGEDYRLVPRIRDQVRFAHLNLVKDAYPSPLNGTLGLDLILFRNVAIYLNHDVANEILQRLFRSLRPGGWLLVGEADLGIVNCADFELHRLDSTVVYRKPLPGVDASVASPEASTPAPPAASHQPTSANPVSFSELLRDGRLDEADDAIERIVDRKERAAMRLQLVRQQLARADVERAMRLLEVCLKEEPLQVEAHLLKAGMLEEAGDLRSAEASCRQALFLDRKCAIAHFNLGMLLKLAGDMQPARRSLAIAADLASGEDVDQPVPHADGMCYGRLREMALFLLDELG